MVVHRRVRAAAYRSGPERSSSHPHPRAWFPLLGLLLAGCAERVEFEVDLPSRSPAKRWARVLEANAHDGKLDYDAIAEERDLLERYLRWAGEHGPEMDQMRESQEAKRIAAVLNAHNAAVIYGVIRQREDGSAPSLADGRDGPFFRRVTFRLDGEWNTLHTFAAQNVLGRYQAPLLHVGLFTGNVDSPPIRWWSHRELTQQLENALREWLADDAGAMRPDGKTFQIHGGLVDRANDFVYWSDAPTLCSYLADYAQEYRKTWLESQDPECVLPTFTPSWEVNHGSVEAAPAPTGRPKRKRRTQPAAIDPAKGPG